jgi:hypothetical protein
MPGVGVEVGVGSSLISFRQGYDYSDGQLTHVAEKKLLTIYNYSGKDSLLMQ